MESYVVRIYRRPDVLSEASQGVALIGLVERLGSGATQPFHNVAELWEILRHDEPPAQAGSSGKR